MSTAGKFYKLDKLGEGTYGMVYMARDKATNAIVALKRMNIAAEDEGVPATTIREICLLHEMQHPNIVRLHDTMFQAPKLTLVFEYCQYDLKKYMDERRGHLEMAEIKSFLKQMLAGLAYLHGRDIVHRDMKPQNLLINDKGELKLADFGLARVDGIPVKKYSHEAVTLWYRSPDVILGSTNYGFAVDMWSVGSIFCEMVTGAPLFNAHVENEQLSKIFRRLGPPTRGNWPSLPTYPNTKMVPRDSSYEASDSPGTQFLSWCSKQPLLMTFDPLGLDLMDKLLQYEPSRRITAAAAMEHPFLADTPLVTAADIPVQLKLPLVGTGVGTCVAAGRPSILQAVERERNGGGGPDTPLVPKQPPPRTDNSPSPPRGGSV